MTPLPLHDPPADFRALVIVADDLGFELIDEALTPCLDEIADESLNYTNVWTSPSCSPYRAQLVSGYWPFRADSLVGSVIQEKHGDTWKLPIGGLLPSRFDRSEMFGKWHLSDLSSQSVHPHRCGWDYWYGTNYNLGGDGSYYGGLLFDDGIPEQWNGYLPEITTERAIKAIERHVPFVYVPMHLVHKPFEAPPSDLFSYVLPDNPTEHDLVIAMSEAADHLIGELVSSGMGEGYTVFVTSDNGTRQTFGGGKGTLDESGLRTFLYVLGAGVEPRVSDRLVCAVDLYQTLVDLSPASPPLRDGISFAHDIYPDLFPDIPERAASFACSFKPNGTPVSVHSIPRAMRDKRWKAVAPDGAGFTEFYDLWSDDGEDVNLLDVGINADEARAFRDLVAHHPEDWE